MILGICYDVGLTIVMPRARELRPTDWLPADPLLARQFSWRGWQALAGGYRVYRYAGLLELDQLAQLAWELGLRLEGDGGRGVRAAPLSAGNPLPTLRVRVEQRPVRLFLDIAPAPARSSDDGEGAFHGWKEVVASASLLSDPAPMLVSYLLHQREESLRRLDEELFPLRLDPLANTQAFCERFGIHARFHVGDPVGRITLHVRGGDGRPRTATFAYRGRGGEDDDHALYGFFVELTDALAVLDYPRGQFRLWAQESACDEILGPERAREYWRSARARAGAFKALVGEEAFRAFCAVDFG